MKRKSIEFDHQAALIKWARLNKLLIFSIPNGAKRSPFIGKREKEAGLLSGACDIYLCKPSFPFHGYFIEMKSPGKKPNSNQWDFIHEVRKLGYAANFFDDWKKAKISIENYLLGRHNDI